MGCCKCHDHGECCGSQSWWWTRQGYYFWCAVLLLNVAGFLANVVLAFTGGNVGANLGAASGTIGGTVGAWFGRREAQLRSGGGEGEALVDQGRGVGA